jgi:hypothetical protein
MSYTLMCRACLYSLVWRSCIHILSPFFFNSASYNVLYKEQTFRLICITSLYFVRCYYRLHFVVVLWNLFFFLRCLGNISHPKLANIRQGKHKGEKKGGFSAVAFIPQHLLCGISFTFCYNACADKGNFRKIGKFKLKLVWNMIWFWRNPRPRCRFWISVNT